MSGTRRRSTQLLAEGAVVVALGTVLSIIKFDMPLGGGVTLCSMLPLVFYSYRNGIKWGVFTAFVHSVIQMLLGIDNVQYGKTALMVFAIAFLDYIVAYTVLGFAGMFRGKLGSDKKEIALGSIITIFARFLCHFVTGIFIWEALWPNAYGYAPVIWSLIYNGSYMLIELVITTIVATIIVKFVDFDKKKA